MNPLLDQLHPYPFEKLRKLKEGCTPPKIPHIALSIGEPKHSAPEFVVNCLKESLNSITQYPATKGSDELREAISRWATKRFNLKENTLSADSHILPVNGTREALFAFAQACINGAAENAKVLMPNPFYQIYEGAALLAGATPHFINCTQASHYHPDFNNVDAQTWDDCQLLYLCSPGNPTGAVLPFDTLKSLIELADKHNFIIVSDECYSELYFDENAPPLGLLEACAQLNRDDYSRCVVFHSLSKRSNLPGLRSGFVAGDASLIEKFLLYRTYHGCAMSPFVQAASKVAWEDEAHVKLNRDLYREKFSAVLEILHGHLDVSAPEAGFYLWPKTPIKDTDFARELFNTQNVTVLPGSFLARDTANTEVSNPGENHVRMALVATLDECIEAAQRIKQFVTTL